MKKYLSFLLFFLLAVTVGLRGQTDISYRLSYDFGSQTYTVAVRSTVAYTGPLARIAGSSLVSVVAPAVSGGFQVTNLTNLQTLSWEVNQINAPAENSTADYLFFSPTNAATYVPFSLPANTFVDVFSFKSGTGCEGELNLLTNGSDPISANLSLNTDNNFVILGAGPGNQYLDNVGGPAVCANTGATYRLTFDSGTNTYTVAVRMDETYTGPLARVGTSSLVSVVAPAITGGFQVTNLTPLQSLNWEVAQVNAPSENTGADYLFFSPTNAQTYTPFTLPANTYVDLFSFQSGTGCEGDLLLYENATDPLGANVVLNSDNNFVVLGAGPGNQWVANENVGNCITKQVTYRLTIDPDGVTYRVAIKSSAAFIGPLARLTSSTLVSIVAPDTDGAGGQAFQVTNLTALTALNWMLEQVDNPTENTLANYLFFSPSNATTYTPFDFPADTYVDVFTFQSGTGCIGELLLLENATDPIGSNPTINSDQNAVILGAGPGNCWHANENDAACTCQAGTDAPVLVANMYANACPSTTADLSMVMATNTPSASSVVLRWYQAADPTDDTNLIMDVTALGIGTYHAAFYDSSRDCYSPSTPVTVVITGCDDDGDGYFTDGSGNGLDPDDTDPCNPTPTASTCFGLLQAKVMLQGALYGTADILMRDDLRAGGHLPLTDPYGLGTLTSNTILALNINTPDAIVDWVVVELRDKNDATTVVATRAGLVQRDGDIVDPVDGVSGLTFLGFADEEYYVSVNHRNHLGVMTSTAQVLTNTGLVVDFTTATPADLYDLPGERDYDGLEQVSINGLEALWTGDGNADGKVKNQGPNTDLTTVLVEVLTYAGNTGFAYNFDLAFGYYAGDYNLDGKVKYQGTGNDPTPVFVNILTYQPLNGASLYNYDFLLEQIPSQ